MPTKYKLILAVLIVTAATIHLLNTGYRDWNAGGDTAYVIGLGFLFFSREKINDERVQELKLKAITVAFALGYVATFAVKLMMNYGVNRGSARGLSARGLSARGLSARGLSAYDLMFVMLLSALAVFHYWQFRDGRETGETLSRAG